MKRLFSHDPEAGITKYFHYNDATDEVTIETHQDVSALKERNVESYNNHTSLSRWGDGKIVASVPMTIYAKWVVEGKDRDDRFLKRWLNDPDNRIFRTRPGKV